jgi:predicted ATPase
MLTQIKLTNFKCFKEETSFPLSQLNLLTGTNGQGKSTLLQSLLLMRQSIESHKRATHILLNGSCVNLGNFNEIRNSRTSKKEAIIFEYDFRYKKTSNMKYFLKENLEDNMSVNIDKMTGGSQNDYFDFSKIHYISADRFGPQAFYFKSNLTTFPNVGVKGELTANVLYKKKDDLVNDKLCLGEDAKTLMSQTEAWLNQIFDGAKVEIPYSDTNILELFLNTSASRDRFKPINVGFGYTYILPIIVSGLIAKKGEILIVENPEAHLHPKAQSRLTQFLAKVSRCGVQVFIESHSEHILNGLRLAVLKQIVTPNDLSILYFQPNSEPTVIQIPVTSDGELEVWPEDFFDQEELDLAEMFKLRRKNR